jgi:hypothetical protein
MPADVSTAPDQLPNTGAASLMTDLVRMTLLAGAMGIAVLVGLRMARRPA